MNKTDKILLIEEVIKKYSHAKINTNNLDNLTNSEILNNVKFELRKNKKTDSLEIQTILKELSKELNNNSISRLYLYDFIDNPSLVCILNTSRLYVCNQNFDSDGFTFYENELVEIVPMINDKDGFFAIPHFAKIQAVEFNLFFKKIDISDVR